MKNVLPLVMLFLAFPGAAQEASPPSRGHDGRHDAAPPPRERDFEVGAKASTVFYFFQIDSNKEDDSLNFSDIDYAMEYDIEPVCMASLDGFIRWKSVTFNAGYKTNRFLQSGGTIKEDGDVIADLTDNEIISQIVQLGLGIADLSTSFRSVRFDFGSADVMDYATDVRVDSGQMELVITDFEILYDFYPLGRDFPLKISPGYKYLSYEVPRIVYRFEDTIEGETDAWAYAGETAPQMVKTTAHMGGALFDMSPKLRSPFEALCALGAFIGPSKTKFVLNGSEKDQTLFTIVGSLRIGISAVVFAAPMKGKVSLEYDLDMIDTRSGESNFRINDDYSESTVKYAFGSTDFYHGVSLTLAVTY